MLDAVVDHCLARSSSGIPAARGHRRQVRSGTRSRTAALRGDEPAEVIRVARRIVVHTGTGVDTIAIAHLEQVVCDLSPLLTLLRSQARPSVQTNDEP
ncbi:hypothetical protein ACWD69_22425 [Micromonospora chokoriensis]